jgi:hypothetical protein
MSSLSAAEPNVVPGETMVEYTAVSLVGETLLNVYLPSTSTIADLKTAIEKAFPEKGFVLTCVFLNEIGTSPSCTVQPIFVGNLGLPLNVHHQFDDAVDLMKMHIEVSRGGIEDIRHSYSQAFIRSPEDLTSIVEREVTSIVECEGTYLLDYLHARNDIWNVERPSYVEVLEKQNPEGLASLELLLGKFSRAIFFTYAIDGDDFLCNGLEALVDERVLIRLEYTREDRS